MAASSPSLTYSLIRIVVVPISSSHSAASNATIKPECAEAGEALGATTFLKRRRPSAVSY